MRKDVVSHQRLHWQVCEPILVKTFVKMKKGGGFKQSKVTNSNIQLKTNWSPEQYSEETGKQEVGTSNPGTGSQMDHISHLYYGIIELSEKTGHGQVFKHPVKGSLTQHAIC